MKTRKILSLALALVMLLALAAPALAAGEATPASYAATINGGTVTFAAYEVGGQVYLRLRDVAKTLNTFDVQWGSNGIAITTGTAYASPVGTEMNAPFSGSQTYGQSPDTVTVNGAAVDLKGILLTDADANGYTYFTPHALETVLGVALPAAPAVAAPWAAAYAEQVEHQSDDSDWSYALIYVDEDDVPELVMDKTGYFVKLFTYVDGQVKEVFDLGYGASGNAGYEYIPRKNVIYSSSSEYAGAIHYETYRKISPNGELEDINEKTLSMWHFDDVNGNGIPDEIEESSDVTIYRYGDQVITQEQYQSYGIKSNDWAGITGTMTADEMLSDLAAR